MQAYDGKQGINKCWPNLAKPPNGLLLQCVILAFHELITCTLGPYDGTKLQTSGNKDQLIRDDQVFNR